MKKNIAFFEYFTKMDYICSIIKLIPNQNHGESLVFS